MKKILCITLFLSLPLYAKDYQYRNTYHPVSLPAELPCSNGSVLKLLAVDPEAVKEIDDHHHPVARIFIDDKDFGYLHGICMANADITDNTSYLLYKAGITKDFMGCLDNRYEYNMFEYWTNNADYIQNQLSLDYISVLHNMKLVDGSYYVNEQGEREFNDFFDVCTNDCFTCRLTSND